MQELLAGVHLEIGDVETGQLRQRFPIELVGPPVGACALVDRREELVGGPSDEIGDGALMATASAAFTLAAWRTADSAQSAFRPWASARALICETESFVTFRLSVSGRSSPPLPTTDAAPIFELGAIAATSAARTTKVAADAAWAPAGQPRR